MSWLGRWSAYRKWKKALKGPEAFDAIAAGPFEWADIQAWKENVESKASGPMLVENYSVKLFTLAIEGADAIRKLSEDRTIEQPKYGLDVEYFPVFNAFHDLYLHITDREAFVEIGDAGRNEIMKPLVFWSIDHAVNTLYKGLPREKLPGIKKDCVEHLNWSNETYGQYKKLFAGPGESLEGTILWRFGIEVAELAGRPGNAIYMVRSREHALSGVNALDAKSYVHQFMRGG